MNYHWTAFEVAKDTAAALAQQLREFDALERDYPAHAAILSLQIKSSRRVLRENGFDENGDPLHANYVVWGK